MNGIGHIGQGGPSFDRESFRREASSILFEGTREMLFSIRDKDQLVSAYDRMDYALAELVDRWSPPQDLVKELHAKLEDRLNFIGRKMKSERIDPTSYWEKEGKRVSIAILKAVGFPTTEMRIDRLIQTAVDVMSQSTNLTREGAEKLVREFAAAECRSLKDILATMGDSPNHMEFMKFIAAEGTPNAKALATETMERMLPTESKRLAVVIRLPVQGQAAKPVLRHQ